MSSYLAAYIFSNMLIRKYAESDFNRVREIALSSFSLDSFHTDTFFTKEEADRIIWEIWTMPAVTEGRKRCLVADDDGIITGFAIYGGLKEISGILGRKTANIIILAVDERFRHSEKRYGSSLVSALVTFFKAAGTGLVTVGTDMTNIPALRCYDKNSFKQVLRWTTYRLVTPDFTNQSQPEDTATDSIPDMKSVLELLSRPISLLADAGIPQDKKDAVLKHYASRIIEDLQTFEDGSLRSFGVAGKGHVIFELEDAVSGISGRAVWRINDLLCPSVFRGDCIKAALSRLIAQEEMEMVEIFIKTGDTELAVILEGCGFKKTHDAVTLHLDLDS